MANTTPSNHQVPVTPPPNHDSFAKRLFAPHILQGPLQGWYGTMPTTAQAQQPSPPRPQTQPPLSGPLPPPHDRAGIPIDPRYMAMASRISAYYQQRCQAVANYQHQKCQAWANMHRQKCQEMMQAAMLVIAWYVRDRVTRRRRRQKKRFKRGLSQRCAGPRVAKGESVRRWVLDSLSDVVPASDAGREELADPEEAEFTMDKEATPDNDTKLYNVADNMIKSQITKIDVPLMGVLNLDESESESEEEEYDCDYDEEYEEEEQEDTGDYEEDDRDDDVQGGNEDNEADHMAGGEENMGSQEVHIGTGSGTRKRARSSTGS